MRFLRIALNLVLAGTLFAAGLHLLLAGSFFLRDRWQAGTGTLFSGASLYLLSATCLSLAAFVAAITRAWLRGDVPMPPSDQLRPHPAYKGQLIVRYWYFITPAIVCLILAFLLAHGGIHRLPSG